MFGRKKQSGAAYKKRKHDKDQETKLLAGSLNKFFKEDASNKISNITGGEFEQERQSNNTVDHTVEKVSEIRSPISSKDNNAHLETLSCDDYVEEKEKPATQDCSDIASWPKVITDKLRQMIVRIGPPERPTNFIYPIDETGRRFTPVNFERRLCNGEMVKRVWMVYSVKNNAILCFCCKLFSVTKQAITVDGYNDWKNMSSYLLQHENSKCHFEAHQKWIELSTRIESNQTIDASNQKLISAETLHWQNVLERLVAIIQFLSQQCLAFRGSNDTIHVPNNGNYLSVVQLLAKFDPIMAEHVRRIQSKEIHNHYLGKEITNELIQLLSQEVIAHIKNSLKMSRYYSIILDCTPDISRTEQMSVVIRFVSIKRQTTKVDVCVQERFLGFIPVNHTTGAALTDTVIETLKKMNIPISDMRGQGYDNGSNMKGKHSGVQKRILDLNPRAFFLPCSAHTLNLVVNDAAMSCKEAISIFGVVQKIYTFLSGSTKRWHVLKENISSLTVKPLCETRWSSRVDALRPFRYHVGEIYDTLIELSEDETAAPLAKHEALCLAKELKSFKFLCGIVIWFKILNQINIVSNLLQSKQLYLPHVIDLMDNTKRSFEEFRSDEGFQKAVTAAKVLANDLETEATFTKTTSIRARKKKRMFTYEAEDEQIQNPEENFKIDFFFAVLDVTIQSISERFSQMENHSRHFQFLYDIHSIIDMPEKELLKSCMNLESILTDPNSKEMDINGIELYEELSVLVPLINSESTPTEVLEFIISRDFAPNVAVALRILLTFPITVASGERSFSKLKLIKNYLRSTMLQERLVGLAILGIEQDLVKEIDFFSVLQNFAKSKARKVKFL